MSDPAKQGYVPQNSTLQEAANGLGQAVGSGVRAFDQALQQPTQQAIPVQAQPVSFASMPGPQAGGPPRGDMGYYDRVPRRIICQFCGYVSFLRMSQSGGQRSYDSQLVEGKES
jgi:hypothetical protein